MLDTLAAFTTCALILSIFSNVIASVFSLMVTELNGFLQLMKLGMISVLFFFFGIFLGGTVIAVHTFHSVGHRGPAIGVCVLLVLVSLILGRIFLSMIASNVPLEVLLENGVDADAARATLESVDEQRQALEGLFSRVANPED